MLQRFVRLILFLTLAFTVYTPSDEMNFKKIFLVLALLMSLIFLFQGYFEKEELRNFWPFFWIAIIGLFGVSVIVTGNWKNSAAGVMPFSYFLLIPLAIKVKFRFSRMLVLVLNGMVALLIISALLDMLHILPFSSNYFISMIANLHEGQISVSPDAILYYVFFLNASPLMLFGLASYLFRKKYFISLFYVIALGLTGTRANVYAGLAMLGIYMLFMQRNNILKIVSMIVGLSIVPVLFDKINAINTVKSVTDILRQYKADYIFASMDGSLWAKIFGHGFMSMYYSVVDVNFGQFWTFGMTNTSEWSYLEVYRQNGLLGIVLYALAILYPLFFSLKSKYYEGTLSLVLFLMVAIHDPFLTTTTGFVLYAVVLYGAVDKVRLKKNAQQN